MFGIRNATYTKSRHHDKTAQDHVWLQSPLTDAAHASLLYYKWYHKGCSLLTPSHWLNELSRKLRFRGGQISKLVNTNVLIINSSQYPRAGSWLLLLSAGAGKVSWTAWCWWKWICHLFYGRLWKGTEPISFAHSSLLRIVLINTTLVINFIPGLAFIICIIFVSIKCSYLHCCIVFHIIVTLYRETGNSSFLDPIHI